MNSAQAILSTAGDGHITGEIVGLEGDHISEIIRRSGCFYEADLLDLWASIPFDPSHMMVDVGANIGNHTVFLGLACPNPILAIEPHPVNFLLLKENVARNGLGSRVETVEACAWDSIGQVSLDQQHAGNMGTFRADAMETGPRVPAFPLDSLLGNRPICALKIDVEGSELHVLRGASQLLQEWKPILFAEAHGPRARRELLAELSPLGYAPIQILGLSETYLFAHPNSPTGMEIGSLERFSELLRQRRLRN